MLLYMLLQKMQAVTVFCCTLLDYKTVLML